MCSVRAFARAEYGGDIQGFVRPAWSSCGPKCGLDVCGLRLYAVVALSNTFEHSSPCHKMHTSALFCLTLAHQRADLLHGVLHPSASQRPAQHGRAVVPRCEEGIEFVEF